jgi:hypothetical protein
MSSTSIAYVPAVEAVKRPVAAVNVIPEDTLRVPVAFANASAADRVDAESVVRVKLIN